MAGRDLVLGARALNEVREGLVSRAFGRPTLNIPFNFAQFERELIGERIRDEFVASRARGMWIGGKVPMGHDVRERELVVNDAEISVVRRVFEVFDETASGVETARPLRVKRPRPGVGGRWTVATCTRCRAPGRTWARLHKG